MHFLEIIVIASLWGLCFVCVCVGVCKNIYRNLKDF